MLFTSFTQISWRSVPLLLQVHAVTTSVGFMIPTALWETRGMARRDTVVHEVIKKTNQTKAIKKTPTHKT